ncbi:tail fiber protein [bacterium]|nr:tail fiber protein [bacterium]NDG30902.1 tail fiber protein [bacterium]
MSNSALGSQSIALLTLPAGTLVDYAGTVEPSGWLLCDGRQLATADYATLFAAIGYSYGGSGANFNIPDFRGRFARYNDNMGTAQGAASRDIGRVHGSTQTQATKTPTAAFTGTAAALGTTNKSVSTAGVTNFLGTSSGTTYASPGTGSTTFLPNERGAGGTTLTVNIDHSHSVSISGGGDAETRPINLSCNKLIKI